MLITFLQCWYIVYSPKVRWKSFISCSTPAVTMKVKFRGNGHWWVGRPASKTNARVTVAGNLAVPITIVPEIPALVLVAAWWPVADCFDLRCVKSKFLGDNVTLIFRENRIFCTRSCANRLPINLCDRLFITNQIRVACSARLLHTGSRIHRVVHQPIWGG